MADDKVVQISSGEVKPNKPKGKPRGGNSPVIQDQMKELPEGMPAE